MRIFLLLFIIPAGFSFAQDLKSIQGYSELLEKSPAEVDSFLTANGFKQETITGLVFTYKSLSETINYTSSPKSIELITSDKSKYLNFNSEVLENGGEFAESDTIKVQNSQVIVSVFKTATHDSKFGTFVHSQTKKTNYYFFLSKNKSVKKEVLTAKTEEKKVVEENPAPIQNDVPKKTDREKGTSLVTGSADSDPTEASTPSSTKTKYFYLGTGLYRYYNNDPMAFSMYVTRPTFNLVYRKALCPEYRESGNLRFRPLSTIEYNGFYGMKYINPASNAELSTSKHFISTGFTQEIRIKQSAFLLHAGAQTVFTIGKMDDSRKMLWSSGLKLGQYYTYTFRNSVNNKDGASLLMGFEQFLSLSGGYIGQLTFQIGF